MHEGPGAQAVLLLADSQLLFRRDAHDQPALVSLRQRLDMRSPLAAYLGAANGERPEFYELFVFGMRTLGITRCRHVATPADADARAVLSDADLVFLAGGDVVQGFLAWQRDGLVELLARRLTDGAQLVGLSAGAIQLGRPSPVWCGPEGERLALLSAVPYVVDAHDEPEWPRLRAALVTCADLEGLGVPTAAGAWVTAHGDVTPLARPTEHLSRVAGAIVSRFVPIPVGDA